MTVDRIITYSFLSFHSFLNIHYPVPKKMASSPDIPFHPGRKSHLESLAQMKVLNWNISGAEVSPQSQAAETLKVIGPSCYSEGKLKSPTILYPVLPSRLPSSQIPATLPSPSHNARTNAPSNPITPGPHKIIPDQGSFQVFVGYQLLPTAGNTSL